jgi:hypothetical protein
VIRRLRQRHRQVIPVLALLTLIALAVALIGRTHRQLQPIPGPLRSHTDQP